MSDDLFDAQDRRTLERAVETWGLPAQVDMAVEEMGEAIVALQQYQRGRPGVGPAEVIDELADVRIMYEQVSLMFGEPAVEAQVQSKMDRLRERLEEADDD